jgi:putative transposase
MTGGGFLPARRNIIEKRYGCKLIHNDAYLLWALRYIHRNPVRAELCREACDYIWSPSYLRGTLQRGKSK